MNGRRCTRRHRAAQELERTEHVHTYRITPLVRGMLAPPAMMPSKVVDALVSYFRYAVVPQPCSSTRRHHGLRYDDCSWSRTRFMA